MLRKICIDESAKASFAIAGVLILLLGSASAVYLAKINSDYRGSQIENKEIGKMNNAIEKAHIEVQTEAYYIAQRAILEATQLYKGLSPNTLFFENLSKYIDDYFPRDIGDYEIYANNFDGLIMPQQKNTLDFGDSNRTKYEQYQGDNRYVDVKELDMTISDQFDQTTRTPYYFVWGYVNYTIFEKGSDRTLGKNMTFEKDIKCPYPFLEETFHSFASTTKGESTDLGRMIKYILTTVVQYKVLMGNGIGDEDNDGEIESGEKTNWKEVISKDDIELAVNLALLLEEIRYYRTVDPESLSTLDSIAYGRYDGERNDIGTDNPNDAATDRTITKLLKKYATLGIIDSADIFILYTCIDSEEIDVESIFAQSIYAIVDQYALKFLDYFGLGDNAGDITEFVSLVFDWFGIDKNIFVESGEYSDGGEFIRAYGNYYYDYQNDNLTSWTQEGDWHWHSSGSYYGNHESNNKYKNNSFDALSKTISIDPDYNDKNYVDSKSIGSFTTSTYYYESCSVNLSFDYKIELYDSNDRGKVQVKGPNDSSWQTLATYTSDCTSWTSKSYDISSYFGQSNVQIRFLFQSNETGVDYGYKVRNIEVTEEYYGRNVKDSSVGGKTVGVQDYLQNLLSGTLGYISNSLSWFNNTVKGYLTNLFKGLAKFTVDIVFSLIFEDDSQPKFAIDPKDDNSILEILESNVTQWIHKGIGDLKDDIQNSEKFITEVTEEFLDMIKEQIIRKITYPLDIWLSELVNWIGERKDDVIDYLTDTAIAADNFLDGATEFFGLGGLYSILKSMISNMVDDSPFWGNLEANIQGFIEDLKKTIEGVISDIDDFINDLILDDVEVVLNALQDVVFLFLDATEQFILLFLSEIVTGSKVANTEYQIGCNYNQEFEFWDGNQSIARDAKDIDCENIILSRKPHYLNATEKEKSMITLDNVDINDEEINNDLLFNISHPIGIHYTEPLEVSLRPFETQWNISMVGRIDLSTRTDNKVFLGNGTHYYTWCNRTLDINTSITVTVFSGWGLEGVDYSPSNTFVGDVIEFLNSVWDALISIVKWGVDAFQKFIDFLGDMIQKVIEEGPKLAKTLTEIFEVHKNALGNAYSQTALNYIDLILDEVDRLGIRDVGPFSAYGLTLRVSIKTDTTLIQCYHEEGTFSFNLTINDQDMELTGEIDFWYVTADIEMHPLNDLDWLHIQGLVDLSAEEFKYLLLTTWGQIPPVEGWKFDIRAPIIEEAVGAEISVESILKNKIIIPAPVDFSIAVNFGIGIIFSDNIDSVVQDLIIETIVNVFNKILQGLEIEMSIQNFILLVLDIQAEIYLKIIEYLMKIDRLEVFFEIGLTGTSFEETQARVAFVVEDLINTYVKWHQWLINNVASFIFNIAGNFYSLITGAPIAPSNNHISISESGWENMYITCGVYVGYSLSSYGAAKVLAAGSVNFPYYIERYIPSLLDVDLGESRAYCGIAGSVNVGTGAFKNFKLEGTVWLLKLEINELYAS